MVIWGRKNSKGLGKGVNTLDRQEGKKATKGRFRPELITVYFQKSRNLRGPSSVGSRKGRFLIRGKRFIKSLAVVGRGRGKG